MNNSPGAVAPLHDPQAEEFVLGSYLHYEDNTRRDNQRQLAGVLQRELFFDVACLEVFDAIVELQNMRKPAEIMTLTGLLREKGFFERVPQGINWLSGLQGGGAVSAIAVIERLRLFAAKRKLAAFAVRIGQASQNGCDVAELIAEADASLRDASSTLQGCAARKPIEFLSPAQLRAYEPPPGSVLVGDCHVTRGSVFVIGGAPGVGKSRTSVALAVAGATGAPWFMLPVHRRFKTLIIQNENGRHRLAKEFQDLDCPEMDSHVRVCPPPPFGLCFDRGEFRNAVASAIESFQPDVVIIDPWNAAAKDDKAKDYLEAFETVRSVLPAGDDAPALGIVAHTRKPRADERSTGRSLLNLLAGSYVLASVPRSAFVLQAASEDTEDSRVVWTCCKNNDGEMGARSAWIRCNGLFRPVDDFNWDDFDGKTKGDKLTWRNVPELLEELGGRANKKTLADKLEGRGVNKKTAYRWLEQAEENGLIDKEQGTGTYCSAA